MNPIDHQQLSHTLRREAERFAERGGAALELGDVVDRAAEIRRGRRLRATVVMTALVLAIAVPSAIVASGHGARDSAPQPTRPAPAEHRPLGLDGLSRGPAPRVPYAAGGVVHLRRGETSPFGAGAPAPVALAEANRAYLVGVPNRSGRIVAHLFSPSGSLVRTWPMQGGFATSPQGNVAALVRPGGTVVAAQDAGERYFELGTIRGAGALAVAAVVGENCSGRSEAIGCTVYVNRRDDHPGVWALTPHHGPTPALPRLLALSAISGSGLVAGTTRITDAGTCSEVEAPDQRRLWATCDHRLLAFSPGGAAVLASSAYADGIGDTELAVLDATTGSPLLDLRALAGATITQMTWEDDEHVLAVVTQRGRWGVVRIGLDGSRELALGPVRGGDAEPPYRLATARP